MARVMRTYLGQAATDGTGLLGAEVKREELLVLVVFPEVLARLGVHDGKDAGDRLANGVTT